MAAPRAGEGVGAFFRAQAAHAAHAHWQIVQLAPTHTPGERALVPAGGPCWWLWHGDCCRSDDTTGMPACHVPRACMIGVAVWRPVPADSACPRAGVFRAWALVGAAMYAVPLRVPRVFYVNSRLPPDRPGAPAGPPLHGARVRRILPAAREPENLYQARAPGSLG